MWFYLRLMFQMLREAVGQHHVGGMLHDRVFWRRVATPVEMDLTAIPVQEKILADPEFTLVQPTLKEVRAGRWRYATASRGIKAEHYLQQGRRNFAIAHGNLIVADIWCEPPCTETRRVRHPDLKLFGFDCHPGETYAFDAFIDPTYRGHNLAAPLQRFLQQTLKREGCTKVYGNYYDDNIPAMWMHRMLRFKELPKRQVSRFFFWVQSTALSPGVKPAPRAIGKR